jgi:hypothetical protein
MTNTTVGGVTGASNSRILHLKYKGGQQEIEVGPDGPIVELVPGTELSSSPAWSCRFSPLKPAGGLVARFVNAEKNGVKPLI